MKKIIIVLVILAALFSLGIVYLNNVFLPQKIKSLIVKGIEDKTGSKVTLGSLKVNIFKGLVLRDLDIYQDKEAIIKLKEASCIILPWSLLEKKIAIPVINFNSPQVFIERRKDNTFNLQYLFSPQPSVTALTSAPELKPNVESAKKGFSLYLYRVNISDAVIIFKDNIFSEPFIKTIDNLDAAVYLSLPASVKFKLSAGIPALQPIKIGVYGEFRIPTRELNAKLNIEDFSFGEFAPYYQAGGLKVTNGLMNLSSDIKMKDNTLLADAQVGVKDLNILRDNINLKSNMDLRAIVEYVFGDKEVKFSGSGKIYDTEVSGLKSVDKISAINCGLTFNNSGLNADDVRLETLGLPIKAKVALNDFSDPKLSLNAVSTSLSLDQLQGILKDKFKFNFPGKINGEGNLSFILEGGLSAASNLATSFLLELINASVEFDNVTFPLQGLFGSLAFKKDGLDKEPVVDIAVKSNVLSLTSSFSINDLLIKISKCSGDYYSSKFSIIGDIDTANPSAPAANLHGELLIDLGSLDKAFVKLKEQFEKIKPEGKVNVKVNLSGNINDLKDCDIDAKLASDSVSLYGLRGKNLSLDYIQIDGIADVPSMRFSLYGGSAEAYFRANLNSQNTPYWFKADLKDVKIEELKLDTPASAKDIAGIIQGDIKVNGFLNDLPGSLGTGTLNISKGKLWELDLFKGLGKLMFSQDFASIIFREGSCSFAIKERAISTDNLMLKSSMVNLSGPVKIGFDNSINAKLNVDILSELVPLSGTFKDVTTAILSESRRFAEIKISGTLKEPKYKFQTAVTDIIKGLTDVIFRKN